jgi:hypothetical protein
MSSSAQTDDHCSIEIKGFQCQELRNKISSLTQYLCGMFGYFSSTKSPSDVFFHCTTELVERESATQSVATVYELIDDLIKWITCHEISNILHAWKIEFHIFDKLLAKVVLTVPDLISAISDSDSKGSTHDALYPTCPIIFYNSETIRLAQSIMPILSRLFFKKSATVLLNQTPQKPVTKMNSYQLATLIQLVTRNLRVMINILNETDAYDGSYTPQYLTRSVNKMVHCLNSILLHITLYIMPLIPDHEHPSSPNHSQTWLVNWHILFLAATEDCVHAAEHFEFPASRHYQKICFNCHQLTCRLIPSYYPLYFKVNPKQLFRHSHCAQCTVTVH